MKRKICVLMFFFATFNFIFGQSLKLKKGEPVQIGSVSGFTVAEENIIGILNGKAVYTYDKAGKTFLFDGQKSIDADGITEIHIYNEKLLVYKKVQIASDGYPRTYIFNGKTLQGPYGVDYENHKGTMPVSLSVTDNVFQNPLVSGLILVNDILAYEVDEYQFDPATPYEEVWKVPARLINRWIIKGNEKISIDLFGNFASYADSKNKKIRLQLFDRLKFRQKKLFCS
ncbi:hypothetical protein [Treponema zioleckii]|uniref:hypothetical protein n=1 Tax=Treponema zioleckii TaxID=331680 RepID=UPI00168AF4B1|nr:hypothetical protein [Treponema zioleckii]